MDPASAFIALYMWAQDANVLDDIKKKVVSQATYDILKTLGTSFVSKVRHFFYSEDEAQRYFEQLCSASTKNITQPYRDSVELFEKLSSNQLDEVTRQQFIEALKKWFSENSNEINNLLEIVKPVNELDMLIDNFINVFNSHGIPRNKIIKVIPAEFRLRMRDFDDNESIKDIITPQILEWTSTFFNVQVDWLDGTSKRIYLCKSYLSLQELFNLILYITFVKNKTLEAYVFKSGYLDYEVDKRQPVALLLRYKSTIIDNDHPIYRYIPIGREWNWGWEKSRYELKYIMYFLKQFKVPITGFEDNVNIINSLIFGEVFPEKIIENPQRIVWHPEDYIELPTENPACAKETKETKKYRTAFYECGYIKYINLEIDRIISDEGDRKYIKEVYLSKFRET